MGEAKRKRGRPTLEEQAEALKKRQAESPWAMKTEEMTKEECIARYNPTVFCCDAAEVCGKKESTLMEWEARHKIPFYKSEGGTRYPYFFSLPRKKIEAGITLPRHAAIYKIITEDFLPPVLEDAEYELCPFFHNNGIADNLGDFAAAMASDDYFSNPKSGFQVMPIGITGIALTNERVAQLIANGELALTGVDKKPERAETGIELAQRLVFFCEACSGSAAASIFYTSPLPRICLIPKWLLPLKRLIKSVSDGGSIIEFMETDKSSKAVKKDVMRVVAGCNAQIMRQMGFAAPGIDLTLGAIFG